MFVKAISKVSVETEGNEMAFSPGDQIAARPRGRMARSVQLALGLLGALLVAAALAAPAGAAFGIESFTGEVHDAQGEPISQAGAHPATASTTFKLNATLRPDGMLLPLGSLRTVDASLPPGFVANPMATPRCQMRIYVETLSGSGCPAGSRVGRATVEVLGIKGGGGFVYNLVPRPGTPAQFAFTYAGTTKVFLTGVVRTGSDYGLGFTIPNNSSAQAVTGTTLTFWGVPADNNESGEEPKAFISNPSDCTAGLLTTTLAVDSWQNPGSFSTASFDREPDGTPFTVDGCNKLEFSPTISSKATTDAAESPSGLDFNIHQPQNDDPDGLSTAFLKNATVTLPKELVVNPSSANGLAACSPSEIGMTTPVGQEAPVHFSESPQTCPDAAKVGTVEVSTPTLDHKLPGSIYIATPYQNPFSSLLSIYLAIEDEQSGIISKLAGKVEPDPDSGQLTARFTENPQLPLEDIDLHFFKSSKGVLTSPLTCGAKTTNSTLTSWSAPEVVDVHPTDSFATTVGCYGSESDAPKNVSFTAGTESPLSGAYSPFTLRLSRKDGTQHITGVDTTLPAGLVGKLAGVAYCPESGIAQAISREHPEQGKVEQQSPSCPSSSEVGTVNVTAGSGITPIPVSGHAYLAGPYKGAPLSLVAIVPAVAGPFDLGTVVDRVALNVGEYDTRIHAVADPLPTIREGIPLDVRSIELRLNRPSFTLNPTSCEAMQIEAQVSTQAGQTQGLNNHFQVGECGRLGFKPSLKVSLQGKTKRTGHPALKAVVTYPQQGQYANIARAQVNLPHSEFLDQGNLNKTCTKPVLTAGACPASTVYGTAKAWTPLLDKPLEGNVYLVGGYGYKLPALVAELNGQIRVLLVGKVDTGKNKGIRNTFEAVPDAPVEKFVLEMKGGKKYGLLENSENLCKKKQTANASFNAQNGKVLSLSTEIANSCPKGHKKAKAKPHGKKKGHGKSKAHKKGK
jgi:hypothetical protein